MTETTETLLAFDYGERHIGIAVGQTLTRSANPLTTVRVTGATPDWAAISHLVRTWQPARLVVGLPLNMDGTEQPITRGARRFGNQLEGRYRLPVHLVDERLTSREARARLVAEGNAGAADHPVAAQIILESWLHGTQSDP
ncbi:MAG: Holliday junction resolvase RuvX [Gammaproteobacteria bacterium]|nr:Holliday junction resolvase RuvX [Gammaproteobacteria bacterium]